MLAPLLALVLVAALLLVALLGPALAAAPRLGGPPLPAEARGGAPLAAPARIRRGGSEALRAPARPPDVADRPPAPKGAGPGPPPAAWPAPPCLPAALVEEALRFVRGRRFAPTEPDRPAFAAEAERLGRKHSAPFGAEALVALWRLEAALRAQRAGTRALRLGPRLARAARGGAGVLELAGRFDLPPLAVLKQLLAERGFEAHQIQAALRSPGRLPPDLAAEAPAVLAADPGSPQNAARTQAASGAFERAVGAELRRRGLAFATEAQLRAGAAPGAPTPDFLLDPPAVINGARVAWVDAKDHPATEHPLLQKSLERAAAKYVRAFGPGAFVFSGGVLCAPRRPPKDVLLLDGAHLAAPEGARG